MMHRIAVINREKRILLLTLVLGCVLLSKLRPSLTRSHLGSSQEHKEYGKGGVFMRMGGHDVAYEFPAEGALKGVVFFAHGCNHACGDLWPPSEACPTCLGLPEEMRIRRTILHRGYAVLGMSSKERIKGCWSELRADGGKDVALLVRKIIKQEMKLDDETPLYALGASSGGQLVLMLPKFISVQGVICQVRGVDPKDLELNKVGSYPPTVFIHMPLHEDNANQIRKDINVLKESNVPVGEILIHPRPVTPEFLAERSPAISLQLANDIVKALRDNGFIDEKGTQYEPPRLTLNKWGPIVQPLVGNLTLELDKSQVTELLNLAWAKHEIISDELDVALEWLDRKGQSSIDAIKELVVQGAV